MTIAVYHNRPAVYGCPTDASDKCLCLCSCLADADGVRLASNAKVADIDIVTTRSKSMTGISSHGDIVASGCIVKQRSRPDRCITLATGVILERTSTNGRVEGANRVAQQRVNTIGRIASAGGVGRECVTARSCVVATDGIAQERTVTAGRIIIAGSVV